MRKTGKNLDIYRASAGSGKTFTLALQYLILCFQSTRDKDFPFKHILAITFTNKAAHELKSRVLSFMAQLANWSVGETGNDFILKSVMDASELSEPEVRQKALVYYERMIYNYGDIHISTIDKFVVSIIRSFSKELGLSANFKMSIDQNEVIGQVRDAILALVGVDEDLTARLVSFTLKKTEAGKSWDIKSDLDNSLAELLKEEGIQAMEHIKHIPTQAIRDFCTSIEHEYSTALDRCEEIQRTCLALIGDAGVDLDWFNGGVKGGFINLLIRDLRSNPKKSTSRQQDTYQSDRWTSGKGKGHEAAIDQLRVPLTKGLDELNELIPALLRLNLFRKNLLSLILLRLLEDNLHQMEQEEENTLINTNNMRIARVLKDNPAPFIYERISQKIDHFLIDEFQDTSVQQWHNFLPLISESLARQKRNIIVGDAKQSIYRWRSGEVQQFIDLPEVYEKGDNPELLLIENQLKNALSDTTRLNKNYRSKNEVIEFNNAFYDFLKKTLPEEYQKVYDGQKQDLVNKDNTGGYVELVRFRKDALPDEEKSFRENSMDRMLDQIKQAQLSGYKGKDICILVTRNADGQLLAGFLRDRGIKVVSSDSFFIGRNTLSHLVVSVMAHLDDQEKDGPKLGILAHLLRLHEREEEFQNLAKRYIGHAYLKSGDKKNKITKPFSPLFAQLGLSFNYESYVDLDLYATCERIISDLRLDSSNVYLLELLHLCAEKTNARGFSMRDFIHFWNEKGKEKPLIIPEAEDAIKIMTVHKSKGLEFPVVMIPFYSGRRKKTLDKAWVNTQSDLVPIALIHLNASMHPDYLELHAKEEAKSALDSLNVLYVATTRASERLYLNFEDEQKVTAKGHIIGQFFASKKGEEEDDRLTFGTASTKMVLEETTSSEDRISTRHDILQDFERSDWRSVLRISLGRDQSFNEQMEFGTLVHDMLAGLPHDKNNALVQEAEKVVSQVHSIPQIIQWESGSWQIKNEASLIDVDGKEHRPDKVYLDAEGKEAIVLDYKTGAQDDKHQAQLHRYVDVLTRMGIPKVSGYLLYTQDLNLIQVA